MSAIEGKNGHHADMQSCRPMTRLGHHWADEIVPLNADITNCNHLLWLYCTAAFANYIRISSDRIGSEKRLRRV